MDTNKNSIKVTTSHINRITLAISLTASALLPLQSIAQTVDDVVEKTPTVTTESSTTATTETAITPAITVDNLDEIYREMATNSRWENLTPASDFYQSPFQVSLFSPQNEYTFNVVIQQSQKVTCATEQNTKQKVTCEKDKNTNISG